jgi:hypothetical protein
MIENSIINRLRKDCVTIKCYNCDRNLIFRYNLKINNVSKRINNNGVIINERVNFNALNLYYKVTSNRFTWNIYHPFIIEFIDESRLALPHRDYITVDVPLYALLKLSPILRLKTIMNITIAGSFVAFRWTSVLFHDCEFV